jgi:NAD(P)-dependent dehydrogenase (short-subunit alcohol dehydrogenase family)
MANTMRFDGLTVLITGAAGGFGRSMARKFIAEGANLALSDFAEDGLEELAKELREQGANVVTMVQDVAVEETSKEFVDLAMSEFGRLDVAINNAGIGHDIAKLADVDSKQAFDTIQVDLMGVFYGMKQQIPVMEQAFNQHGRTSSILNVSSLAGIGGAPRISMYSAAKHGVIGLTKSAALEYARRGIRVNAICPSFARTPMVEKDMLGGSNSKEAEEFLVRGIPMRRMATPDEITQAMLWACDPENSFTTGQAIAIDGGTSAM